MTTKEKWAEIIKNFEEKGKYDLIERELSIPLKIPLKRSISLIGPRRAGKTYEMFFLINQLKKQGKKVLYVNFERADLGVLNEKDLVLMLETYKEINPNFKKIYLFLDEIQNVSEWEKFVRMCLDEGISVYLSGSSSKLLSKEIATSMGGRNLSYFIYPLSFKEFLKFNNFELKKYYSSKEKSKLMSLLKEYLMEGGYPEKVLYKNEKDKVLRDIFDTAIYRDVIEREKIRNVKALKLFISALISSKEFSVNKFYNYLKSQGIKIGKNVLYNYLEYLEDAFFVFTLRKFNLSYKKAEQSLPKVYFVDNGLLSVSGIDDKGRLMENLVFMELKRREKDVAYFQNPLKEEVDFVIKKGKKVEQLIQVCYSFNNFMTREREKRPLVKASKEFKCNNLLIITLNEDKKEKFKGKTIKYVSLWKWLLE